MTDREERGREAREVEGLGVHDHAVERWRANGKFATRRRRPRNSNFLLWCMEAPAGPREGAEAPELRNGKDRRKQSDVIRRLVKPSDPVATLCLQIFASGMLRVA